jgi:hypothetical protein
MTSGHSAWMPSPLAVHLVATTRREDIEPFGIDAIDEGIARAGQDDYAISHALADLMKELHELLMGLAIGDQRATVGM